MNLLRSLPRFRRAYRLIRVLHERESWPQLQIEAYQLARINTLWSTATRDVRYYREIQSAKNLPKRFESLEQYSSLVPTLDKQFVRKSPQSFLSSKKEPGKWHRTGGSTGVPLQIFWSHKAHREMLACKYRYEDQFNVDIFERKVFLWGHSGSFAPGIKGKLSKFSRPAVDHLRNRLRLNAYHLAPSELAAYSKLIQDFRPSSIYGYSSAVHLLGIEAARSGVEIPTLKLVSMTAEPADQLMLRDVRAAFGVPAAIEYGSVECGIMAYSTPLGELQLREDVTFLECLPREDGRFDIVVTVLNNPSFPLLRYRIEDITNTPIHRPAMGFGRLSEVTGRSNDILIGRRGARLHAMAIKHVFEHEANVRRFQAIQHSDGRIEVMLELDQECSEMHYEKSRKQIENMVDGFPVKVTTTHKIQGNLAGKHRWIVSHFDNSAEANASVL